MGIWGTIGKDSLVGTAGNDYVDAYGDNDTVSGGDGNDTIYGGAGSDVLYGGAGNDRISIELDNGADTAEGNDGDDQFDIYSSSFYANASGVAKLDGGNGDDHFNLSLRASSKAAAVEITGGAGVDTYSPSSVGASATITDFVAGAGGDVLDLVTLFNELGSTYYHGGNPFGKGDVKLVQVGNDTEVYARPYGGTMFKLFVLKDVSAASLTADNFKDGWHPDGSPVAGSNIDASGSNASGGYGGNYNDTITGGTANNLWLSGAGGDDLINGGSGNEIINGSYGNDTLNGGGGNDTITGGYGDDLADGGDGNDVFAWVGDAISVDGPNGDTVLGGAGDDTFSFDRNNVVFTGGSGTDVYQPYSEMFSYGAVDNSSIRVADFATGAGGDKIDLQGVLFRSYPYSDVGGNPFDPQHTFVRLVQDGADTKIQFSTNANGQFSTMMTLLNVQASALTADNFVAGLRPDGGAVIGKIEQAADANLTLRGSSLNDTLTAVSGNNSLLGAGGDDLLQAGSGSDDGSGDTLDGGGGNDTLIGGAGHDSLNGGYGNDLLQGGDGNDTLESIFGADTLQGGAGNDKLTVAGNEQSGLLVADGGTGDDSIYVAGSGAEGYRQFSVVSGGDGRDTFKIGYMFNGWAEITDFRAGDNGDVLDVTNLLTNSTYQGGNPTNADLGFLRMVQDGADLLLQLDYDGAAGSTDQFVTVVVLRNVSLDDFTLANMVGANPKGPIGPGQVLVGTSAAEQLDGGYFNDTISGGEGGGDTLNGADGDDVLHAADSKGVYDWQYNLLGGGNGNDTLYGGKAADNLTGGAGDDKMYGGDGDDYINFGSGNDLADGGDGDDTFSIDLSINDGNATLSGGAGKDILALDLSYLSLSNNVISFTGGAGDDTVTLYNYASNWSTTRLTVTGGAGSDSYKFNAFAATANYHITDFSSGAGGDYLDFSTIFNSLNLSPQVWLDPQAGGYLRFTQQGAALLVQIDLDGSGSKYAPQTIVTLDNFKSADAGAINFTGVQRDGNWGMNDTLYGSLGSDTLAGYNGDDKLEAGRGNDVLDGGTGKDTMTGGAGDDLYRVDDAGDVVTEQAGGGLDTVETTLNKYTLAANVELLKFTGDGDFYGIGNSSGNAITGGSGNDTLDGNGGGDILTGNEGNDTYIVRTAEDRVVEAADAGFDTVQVAYATTYTLGANIEDASAASGAIAVHLTGNALDNTLAGNAAANILNGGLGNDTLVGGAGADTLIGGKGDDMLVVEDAGDQVTELAAEGHDTVQTSLGKYLLAANVEDLIYSGKAGFAGSGNALDNVIKGGSGNDTLLGGAGNDTLYSMGGTDSIDGGDGDDTVILSGLMEHYQVSRVNGALTLTNTLIGERVQLTGVETLKFTDGSKTTLELLNNQVSEFDDFLSGTDGDDVIDGKGGADAMAGGLGDDRYVLDNSKDVIKENAGEGADTAELAFKAAGTYVMDVNVENAVVTAAATIAVNVTGNALDNLITGNAAANTLAGGAGNDTLDGGAGADKLSGGLGDDVYRVDNAGDVVTEGVNEGIDTVRTTLSSYTLAANVENLVGPGNGVLNGTGNALANRIDGGLGNDTLSGQAGDDTLKGSVGNDSLLGGDGNDELDGGIGANIIDGGAGSDSAIALADFSAYIVTRPNATDTVLVNAASGESLTLRNVEFVKFNGTLMAIQDVQRNIKSVGNDTLVRGDGNDTLDGGLGADSMSGGAGDDTYLVDDANDVIIEAADGGLDLAQVAYTKAGNFTLAADLENAVVTAAASVAVNLTGNDQNNTLTGNAAANVLNGGAGNDTLDGGLGADKLSGGLGDDLYKVDNAGDSITELAAQGKDRVATSLAKYTLAANVEELSYTGAATFSGTGNELGNSIGGASGNDTLTGLAGNDSLSGGTGNDSLLGGDGADQLDAGTGNDVADGGAGTDTLILAGNFASYNRSRPNGTDLVLTNRVTGDSVTVRNVEQFMFADGGKVLADLYYNIASVGNDSLFGGDGNDTINGGTGADEMTGGKGNDTYTLDQSGDKVFEAADSGADLVLVAYTRADTYTLGDNIENATVTAAASIAVNLIGNALDNILTGNAAANTLSGGGGDDRLDGGLGADKLSGGMGDDLYIVDNAGDVVTELAAQGKDRVETALAKYTLSANAEDLLYTGTAAFSGTGNELANAIEAGAGNDTLTGLAGDDTLTGGAGNDSLLGGDGADQLDAGPGVDVADGGAGTDTLILLGAFADYVRSRPNGADLVLVNMRTQESVTVRNVEQFVFADDSKALADVIANSASTANDSLTGTDGNDSLDGGAGIDTLAGGLGNDIYVLDQMGDVVLENSDAGTDLVNVAYTKAGTYTLGDNIENASVTAAASVAVHLTGNSLDNILTGNGAANTLIGGAGKDTLDGGAGADKMDGGSGDDSYVVDNAGDTLTELTGGGRDLVTVKGISSYSLASEVEDLVFSGATAFTGNGNALANSLAGGSGADVLNGLAGNDTLTGNAGNDKLLGGDGNDVLSGGDGNDSLTGGNGADTFVLAAKSGSDTVADFVSGTDKLALSQSVFGVGTDLVIDNAVVQAGPGGFGNDAELVILTQNVATLNLSTAAAAIGSANSAYAAGDKALFALHSGSTTTVYLFTSSGADATVSAGELTQLVTLTGTASTAAADYLLV